MSGSGAFALYLGLLRLASAATIISGTSSLSGVNDQCTNPQEFRCMNDICDPLSGVGVQGTCRNGDAVSKNCMPSQSCSQPTAGHCLETTISAAGLHAMPDSSVGTPKHFNCVNVQNLNVPVILWENTDCTGKSCFIPTNGNFGTWAHGEQGNCVEIGVTTPVNTTACLSPGQNSQFPVQGGFPSDVPEAIGGNYGLPVSTDNTQECSTLSPPPSAILQNTTSPPELSTSDQIYHSGLTDTDGIDPSDLGKKLVRGIKSRRDSLELNKRAINAQTLRKAFPNYKAQLVASGAAWLVSDVSGRLSSWKGSLKQLPLSADHVVELSMIVNFFANGIAQQQSAAFYNLNQRRFLQDFVNSQGRAFGQGTCQAFLQFAAYAGGLGNMRGVDQRVNNLKAVVINHVMLGAAAPAFASTWTRIEAHATLEYFFWTQDQAINAAYQIAGFLETLPGMNANNQLSNLFSTWVNNIFNQGTALLEGAVKQPNGYFAKD